MPHSAPEAGIRTTPPGTLNEIRGLLAHLPAADLAAGTAMLERLRQASAGRLLGSLGDGLCALASWQGRFPPTITHPRLTIFAATHGLVADLLDGPGLVASGLQTLQQGQAPAARVAALLDADLRVYEMNPAQPCADSRLAPAMAEADGVRAMAYGMMAVEPGVDLLLPGLLAPGTGLAAAALCLQLFGGNAADWIDSGLDDRLRQAGQERVAQAAACHAAIVEPLAVLLALGGYELAALAGMILAARLARVPVLLAGLPGLAVLALLYRAEPRSVDHCLVAQASTAADRRLAQLLNKTPLFAAGMQADDGISAAMAALLLRAGIACSG